jgi:O-methyltransferase
MRLRRRSIEAMHEDGTAPEPMSAAPRVGGGDEWAAEIIAAVQPFTMTSPERIYGLCLAVDHVARHQIPGAIVECGVWKGGSAMASARTLDRIGDHERHLVLFDTFRGMTPPTEIDRDLAGRSAAVLMEHEDPASSHIWAAASLDEVRQNLASTGYEHVQYVEGDVLETIPDRAPEEIALLRLDTDWYESTRHELHWLFPRISSGGILIVDDYGHWSGARRAVDEYFREVGSRPFLSPLDYTGRLAVID